MKRSELNTLMRSTIEFINENNFKLPPFAYWGPEEWKTKGPEADEIRDCMLGWDVTDFGGGDFQKLGLVLFTIRNGHLTDERYPKAYGEKLLIVGEEQLCPMHYHWQKTEDIINRGGGNLVIELYNSTDDDKLAESDIEVSIDGVRHVLKAGSLVTLRAGESICLPCRLYHRFWGEKGKGTVLVGEVSAVNDDNTDNCFLEPVGRFPAVEEDEEPLYLLFTEYPSAKK